MSSGTQFTFIMLSASAHKSSKNPFGKNGLFNGASPMMLFQLAKDLRRNMTDAEKQLWFYLKNGVNGFKFRRQHPIGLYIADFYCRKLKLIIEVDGKIHDLKEVKQRDAERENDLIGWGYTVVRFSNQSVMSNAESVLQYIKTIVEEESEKIKL